MSRKLKTLIITLILAFVYVFTDVTSVMAFGLDPSEIKTGVIMIPTLTAAGYLVWKVKTWIYADGHTEDVDHSTNHQDDN